jgi:hypothetical protein
MIIAQWPRGRCQEGLHKDRGGACICGGTDGSSFTQKSLHLLVLAIPRRPVQGSPSKLQQQSQQGGVQVVIWGRGTRGSSKCSSNKFGRMAFLRKTSGGMPLAMGAYTQSH